ncbi:hypothetical protein [Streptomyces pseudovenezuelae]|uniref:hypothetical protein n=1 Tax=Streptomyces pseudovenezuelae TaxID=67350 RepID=UPI002E3429F1|nr:hypothetical protein [Streptomyces pseudovenezuelae]
MGDTFGGVWTRPPSDGRGHSQRELQERASFDANPAAGCSCLMFALFILAALAAVLGVVLT